jgi:cold shock CspA family protein
MFTYYQQVERMSKFKQRDEILFCERCGISFLWSAEEQKRSQSVSDDRVESPHLCPGCRHLLPTAGRTRGLVKWFDARKRYGFIVCPDQPDLFVHATELADAVRLHPGDLVEFSADSDERGKAARAVRVLNFDLPGS